MPRTKEILLSVETLQERMKIPAETMQGHVPGRDGQEGKK